MRPRIVLFCPDPALLEQTRALLDSRADVVQATQTWDWSRMRADTADCGVLVVPWLDLDFPTVTIRRYSDDLHAPMVVLVTEGEPHNLRGLTRVGDVHVVYIGEERRRLPTLVQGAGLEVGFRAVRRRLLAARLSPCTRCALNYALDQRPAAVPACDGEPTAPARSLRDLAARTGFSPRQLRRAAGADRVDLALFLKLSLALRAVQVKRHEGLTWEAVAWRLGYRSSGGLTEAFKSLFGCGPAKLQNDIGRWFNLLERQIPTSPGF